MATAPALELTGLTKAFGPVVAVDGIDLRVDAGEVVALLGPNGAGKSTTVDLALGLAPPDHGTVRLWGMAPAEACRAGLVGALQQTGGLLGAATVAELVEVIRSLSPAPLALDDVLATARVTDIAHRRADRLSGGQVQRVRFAMAIAGDPDLLVLDEPTVAMDVVTRRSFWAAMREWTGRGRTVVFATHYLEEADAFSDRVVVMAAGRIVADGTASAIKGLVAGRTVAATVPALAAAGHDAVLADLRALPGVVAAAVRGGRVTLSSTDSDRTLRALLAAHADACDVEVTGSGLEEAFVALTGGTDAIAPDAIARNAIAPIGATPAPAP